MANSIHFLDAEPAISYLFFRTELFIRDVTQFIGTSGIALRLVSDFQVYLVCGSRFHDVMILSGNQNRLVWLPRRTYCIFRFRNNGEGTNISNCLLKTRAYAK